MKIKKKYIINSVYTFNSPYPDENGEHSTKSEIACCGNCGHSVEQARYYKEWNYCPYCGKKIDWE